MFLSCVPEALSCTALAGAQATNKENEKYDALYESYKDASDDHIGPEGVDELVPCNLDDLRKLAQQLMLHVSAGVEKLCNDLREDPSSRRVSSCPLHHLRSACKPGTK